jgi:uncharacterized protein YecT (DUF1311 family)
MSYYDAKRQGLAREHFDYVGATPEQYSGYERGRLERGEAEARRWQEQGAGPPQQGGNAAASGAGGLGGLGFLFLGFIVLSAIYAGIPAVVACLPVLFIARSSADPTKSRWRYRDAYVATFWGLLAYEACGLVFLEIAGASGGYVDPEIRAFAARLGQPPRGYPWYVYLAFCGWQAFGLLAFAAVLRRRMRTSFDGARGFRRAYAASISAMAVLMAPMAIAFLLSLGRAAATGPVLSTSPMRRGVPPRPVAGTIARQQPAVPVRENQPGAQIPGVPDDKTCRDALAESKAPASTQQELTAQAGANAMLAICDMGHAYASLVRSPAFASAASKLDATRTPWDAYLQAHRVERSPHANEQGYYGSSRPTCQNMDESAMASGRAQDLRALGVCRESNAMAARAKQAAHIADAALNDSYRKMRAASATDPLFLAAFQRAEIAWMKYRDAQVDLASAGTGGSESACAQRELERVTRARTQVIQAWANAQEGDVCAMR